MSSTTIRPSVQTPQPRLRERRPQEIPAEAAIRLRLQRDLLLCVLDGGCSPARVLGLGEALGETVR